MSDTDPDGLAVFTSEPIADRRAQWVVDHRHQLGQRTKGELGGFIGLRTKGAITDVQRRAAVRLRPLGETLTEPTRDSGYRSGASADDLAVAISYLERFSAIGSELGRLERNAAAIGGPLTTDLTQVIGRFAGDLNEWVTRVLTAATDGA